MQKGEQAHITQSLGGSYTVVVNGNMFRIEGKDADALGLEVAAKPVATGTPGHAGTSWKRKSGTSCAPVTIPEIPVNIVDLGLIYDCHLSPVESRNRSRPT